MWSITVTKHGLEGARVRVKATSQLGTIRTVMPDAEGNPWSLHVVPDDHVDGEPPLVLAPDEVSRIDLH